MVPMIWKTDDLLGDNEMFPMSQSGGFVIRTSREAVNLLMFAKIGYM
jgi:hypothetical protein